MRTPFNKEEIDFILDNYKTYTRREMAVKLNRPYYSVFAKVQQLNITPIRAYEKEWTIENDNFIKNNFIKMTTVAMAEFLNKDVKAVRYRLGHFGLKKFINNFDDNIIRCINCKQDLPKIGENFTLNKKNNKPYSSVCRPCQIKAVRKIGNTPLRYLNYLLQMIKNNSNRNIKNSDVNNLDLNYLKEIYDQQGGRCVITGEILGFTRHKGRNLKNMSIDRIDSSRGYIKGNIQLVSLWANLAKSNLTIQEFNEFINKSFIYLNKVNNA